jgi:membrane-associated phospholipid phosphatase
MTQDLRRMLSVRTDEVRNILHRHALLGVLVVAYGLLAFSVTTYFEFKISGGMIGALVWHFVNKVPQMVILVLFGRLVYLTYVAKVPNRMEVLRAEILAVLTRPERLFSGFLAFALMGSVLMSFAQLKMSIPLFHPFSWDVAMMKLDQLLHFGRHPYALAHAVFGGHYSLTFFSLTYNYWLFVTYFVLFGACFVHPDSPQRMQYMIAFLFTWGVGGNLMAILFSSAGPPYYALLGLGDVYEPLLAMLRSHAEAGGMSETGIQDRLWQTYTKPNGINSISAFPSMHVASSVLMAIYGFAITRWLGYLLSAFAATIMVGSVLLGWHYAVDGYAGALIALASWKLSGWLIRSRIGPFRGAVA